MSSKLWQGNSVTTLWGEKCHYNLSKMHIALHVMWPCSTFLPVFPANIICICNKSDGSGARKLGFVIGLIGKFFKEVYYSSFCLMMKFIFYLALNLFFMMWKINCSFFALKINIYFQLYYLLVLLIVFCLILGIFNEVITKYYM